MVLNFWCFAWTRWRIIVLFGTLYAYRSRSNAGIRFHKKKHFKRDANPNRNYAILVIGRAVGVVKLSHQGAAREFRPRVVVLGFGLFVLVFAFHVQGCSL